MATLQLVINLPPTLHLLFGSQRRRSLPCLVRDSLCTALQTKILKWRPKSNWTESSLQKLECLLAPKTKQSYLFLAPLQWPWQGCCWNLPRECNAVRRSCVPPPPYRHYRHYRHCPPHPNPSTPRPFASVRFDPLAWPTSKTL